MRAPEKSSTPALPAVIVAGASAGGVRALGRLVAGLPADLAAALLVVLHMLPGSTSMLAAILDRAGRLPASTARHGEPLCPAHVYVAPPDKHLLVQDGLVQLERGPRENGHRPALDPTMRSVAAAYGPRAIGVVLSGNRDDGSAGLVAITHAGGHALVQDPEECEYQGMPRTAIASVDAAAVLGIDDLARRLTELVSTAVTDRRRTALGPATGNGPVESPS